MAKTVKATELQVGDVLDASGATVMAAVPVPVTNPHSDRKGEDSGIVDLILRHEDGRQEHARKSEAALYGVREES